MLNQVAMEAGEKLRRKDEGEREGGTELDSSGCGVLWNTDLLSMSWVPLRRASYLD